MLLMDWIQFAFFFSGIISMMLGSYCLFMAPGNIRNRLFFILCLAIGVWGIGFSMAVNAPNEAVCLFWRRFSALGWGPMYAVLLHFAMVFPISGMREEENSHPKWNRILPLLYLPALLMIYLFAVSPQIAPSQYQLVKTTLGWTNVPLNNHWDWIFNIYYSTYLIAAMFLIGRVGFRNPDRNTRTQARVIVISFLSAFALGTATDIIGNAILPEAIPQLAPIILLIPIAAIHFSILTHGFLNPKHKEHTESILTKETQNRVYTMLSICLFLGAPVSYTVQYLYYGDWYSPISSSLFILFLGGCILALRRLQTRDSLKDSLLIALVFLTIPTFILIFKPFGGVTIWAFSFLFLFISVLFTRKMVLIAFSVSMLGTEILIWILQPEVALVLDEVDYVGRIAILCLGIWIAYGVNALYVKRLQQNTRQLQLQKFLSEVSSDFIGVDVDNLRPKMQWVSRLLGKLYGLDRICLFHLETDTSAITCEDLWTGSRLQPSVLKAIDGPIHGTCQITQELNRKDSLMVSNLERGTPLSASRQTDDQASDSGITGVLRRWQISSYLAVSIAESPGRRSVLFYLSQKPKESWSEEEERILRMVSRFFHEATRKTAADQEIHQMAYYDQLTGLPNKRLMQDRLNQAVALARRTGQKIVVMSLDIDTFRTVNDVIGHSRGDQLLCRIAGRMSTSVRHSDTVSRVGGDEFVVLLTHVDPDANAAQLAEKMLQVIHEPIPFESQEYQFSASIGVSEFPSDGLDDESLLRHADMALHQAMEMGKNRFVVCSTALKEDALRTLRLTNSLYHALDRGELYLHYQPQIDVVTGKLDGLEALVRWMHPEHGFVSPAAFIPIAEQTGVIHDLGDWVLRSACQQAMMWQSAGHPAVCVAVNVSARQLRSRRFVEWIRTCLSETGLPADLLEIEITESVAMDKTDEVVTYLEDIQALGVKIAIDDFGTHYSSLSRLKRLPIDRLKIDKQFIDELEENEKDRAIVRTIVNLAHNLKLKVIAEGVEAAGQADILRDAGCDAIQGYFYGKPMSVAALEASEWFSSPSV